MFKYIVTAIALTVALYGGNYEDGDEAYGKGDTKTAVSFWEKGAKKGEIESQFMLGLLYLRGDDVELDSKKAAELLAKIFTKENETLQITIALAYYKNRGHEPGDQLSVNLFEAAINKEGKVAQYNLGMLFVTGAGADKDLEKGAVLIKKAKNANSDKAKKAWKKYALDKY